MKKLLILMFAAVLFASCTAALPKQFTALADKVEKQGESFSAEQWDKVNAQFDKLMEKYNQVVDKLNADQKKVINAAIGRYQAASLKAGLGQAASAVEELVEGAKGFLEGLGGGDDGDKED